MNERLDDYLSRDPETQAALLKAALELADKDAVERIVQHIILRQNVPASAMERRSDSVSSTANEIMLVILRELRKAGKTTVPDRAVFSVGSVAYDHCDIGVRKEAADLLVEWALWSPPPNCQ